MSDAGLWERAARCYEAAGTLGDAARCYARAGVHYRAGELYALAGDHRSAADALLTAGEAEDAAWVLADRAEDPVAASAVLAGTTTDPLLRRLVQARCAYAPVALPLLTEVQHVLAA